MDRAGTHPPRSASSKNKRSRDTAVGDRLTLHHAELSRVWGDNNSDKGHNDSLLACHCGNAGMNSAGFDTARRRDAGVEMSRLHK